MSRPTVVWVMCHSSGAAKVTQLHGALVTDQQILDLQKEEMLSNNVLDHLAQVK